MNPEGLAPAGQVPPAAAALSALDAPVRLALDRGPPPPAFGTVLLVEFEVSRIGL